MVHHVVGAEVQGTDPEVDVVTRAQAHDRTVVVPTDQSAHLDAIDAVEVGKLEVDEEKKRSPSGRLSEPVPSGRHSPSDVAVGVECTRESTGDLRVVLDHQHVDPAAVTPAAPRRGARLRSVELVSVVGRHDSPRCTERVRPRTGA